VGFQPQVGHLRISSKVPVGWLGMFFKLEGRIKEIK
jgi:hypothetical protein